jgi:hypothetical protein
LLLSSFRASCAGARSCGALGRRKMHTNARIPAIRSCQVNAPSTRIAVDSIICRPPYYPFGASYRSIRASVARRYRRICASTPWWCKLAIWYRIERATVQRASTRYDPKNLYKSTQIRRTGRLWSVTTTHTARRNTRCNLRRRGEVASFASAVAVTSMKVAASALGPRAMSTQPVTGLVSTD